jgi:hypothetical protein
MIESDCEAAVGRLKYIDVLYVVMPHMTDAAGAGIAAWVSKGGTVFATAGAGLLNQANATNKAFAGLMGITQHSVYIGTQDVFNATGDQPNPHSFFPPGLSNMTLSHSYSL